MALTQEQTNIDNGFKATAADIKAINASLALKATLIAGKIDPAQIPDIAIVDFLGTVANQAAMLALVGQKGDWAIRSDDGKVYVIKALPTTVAASWQALSYPAAQVPDNYDYAAAYNTAKV